MVLLKAEIMKKIVSDDCHATRATDLGDFLDIRQEMECLSQTWDVTVEAVMI